jgi:hypothetical protein
MFADEREPTMNSNAHRASDLGRLLVTTLLLASQCACSSNIPSPSLPVAGTLPQASHQDKWLYASVLPDNGNGFIGIFNPNVKPFKLVGKITALQEPWGLALDSNGTLYAVDRATNAVYVFLANKKKPSAQYTQPSGQSAYSVAVGTDGTIYVANYVRSTSVSVAVYPQGSSNPSETLTTTDNVGYIPEPIVGVDDANNVYVVYQNSLASSGNYVNVTTFPAGSSNGSTVELNDALGDWAGQAAFNNAGTLFLAGTPYSPSNYGIGVFPAGKLGATKILSNGNPEYSIALGLSTNGHRIYSSDGEGNVAITSYPKGALLYIDEDITPGYPHVRGLTAGR